uniref:Uncharacterized protein n=1 Tax=Vespula pensylvanica TaxID=30213 RepID=A0A834NZK9_VESPE|nr:hypothetical protein H0235_009900 [Vespula pensylvanica]
MNVNTFVIRSPKPRAIIALILSDKLPIKPDYMDSSLAVTSIHTDVANFRVDEQGGSLSSRKTPRPHVMLSGVNGRRRQSMGNSTTRFPVYVGFMVSLPLPFHDLPIPSHSDSYQDGYHHHRQYRETPIYSIGNRIIREESPQYILLIEFQRDFPVPMDSVRPFGTSLTIDAKVNRESTSRS